MGWREAGHGSSLYSNVIRRTAGAWLLLRPWTSLATETCNSSDIR